MKTKAQERYEKRQAGMTIREIAEAEGVPYQIVNSSIAYHARRLAGLPGRNGDVFASTFDYYRFKDTGCDWLKETKSDGTKVYKPAYCEGYAPEHEITVRDL